VGAHLLSLDIKYIYFLMALSHLGSHVTLTYLHRYYVPMAESRKGKVAIRGFQDLPLQNIIFTIARMEGSASPHMALQIYFQYFMECMEPRVFN
jgi:hypothetical protein